MLVSKLTENTLSHDIIDRLLFQGITDTGKSADCILVLGSLKAAKYRVPIAAEAYKAGRSGKLLLSGGKVRNFPEGEYSESEYMRRAALELGIADEDIIIENKSENTIENILCALFELQRTIGLHNVHRLLLVTTAYHMRRSLAIAGYFIPAHIEVIPCPANDTSTRRENWMLTPIGVKRAKDEAMKIIAYVKNGVIPDFEI